MGTPDQVTVIPGNHDAYVEVKWREAWAHWSDYMCGDGTDSGRTERDTFPFLRRRGPVALIGMSTAIATPPTFATGRLGGRQLRGLDKLLDGLTPESLCRVLLLHHPPVSTMTDYRRRLVDGDALGLFSSIARSSSSCAVTSTSSSSAGCAPMVRRSRS